MKLIFRINYATSWGQELRIVGNIAELGANNVSDARPMSFSHDEEWYMELDVPVESAKGLEYNYVVRDSNYGTTTREWGSPRRCSFPAKTDTLLLIDAWNSVSAVENTFLTSPFVDVLLKKNFTPSEGKAVRVYTHSFSVQARC